MRRKPEMCLSKILNRWSGITSGSFLSLFTHVPCIPTNSIYQDVIIAKSRRLEIRQASNDANAPFPLVLQVPVNGRITSLIPLKIPQSPTSYLFITTDRFRYAVISFDLTCQPYPMATHSAGSFRDLEQGLLGREAECSPLVSLDPHSRCLALHLFDGLVTILPINLGYSPPKVSLKGASPRTVQSQLLGDPYHARIEERTLLDITFLHASSDKMPQLCLLHQDSRGLQHLISHALDLSKKQIIFATDSLKKSRVDGGSSLIIPVPPVSAAAAAVSSHTSSNSVGGVLVLGQRQITYLQTGISRVVPLPSCLLLTWENLPPLQGSPRYLLSDEFGNLHMLCLTIVGDKVSGIALDTLGSCVMASALTYIHDGLCFVGSCFGDSQLIQIMDKPIPIGEGSNELEETTYLSVVEEYTHLGPIVDFDLVPTPGSKQSQVITASGSSQSGSLRLIRNGIGMNEYAAVDIPGIQSMWSIRKSFKDAEDAYLVQSFVGDTRVLGVVAARPSENDEDEETSGTLEEVVLSGLDATVSSLFVGNVQVGDTIVQITESEIRVLKASSFQCCDTWVPQVDDLLKDKCRSITVASANEAGQIIVALRGGLILYLRIKSDDTGAEKVEIINRLQMDQEVSCLNLNPFSDCVAMEIDDSKADALISNLACVGLWDDSTVRLFSLGDNLKEVLQINLSTDDDDETEETESGSQVRRNRNNMMARSLCLVSLDSNSSSSSGTTSAAVHMLFVGLGDGTLISFAVVDRNDEVKVQSKKEVSLGTQRISLITLQTERGGTCVLVTGDRPTVIYLAGGDKSSVNSTPKLCYSNVNLSTCDGDDDDISRPPSHQSIAVNVATPFFSPQLFNDSSLGSKHFSLCVSDDSVLRLGIIDDIQKLHVTTCRLGMVPRRVVHCSEGRMFAVGCIETGIKQGGLPAETQNMGNCLRFMDDTNFDDIERIDLEPHEMILSMVSANLTMTGTGVNEELRSRDSKDDSSSENHFKRYLLVGTAYALPDEDEPTRGRILLISCDDDSNTSTRAVHLVTEFQVRGGVYSMCQFYNGMVLATVNSKTQILKLTNDGGGLVKLNFVGVGHHGHILSLSVKSKASKEEPLESDVIISENPPSKLKPAKGDKEQLAIVADLMRSISLVQYFRENQALEEIARDFNPNWATAVEMLTDDIYLGAENWNNLFILRRNAKATSEEVRCRLDTVGEFHLGEMCNKFMCGSLVMPHTSRNSNASGKASSRTRKSTLSPAKAKKENTAATGLRNRRPTLSTGSQTLFATVDGTLGSILGIDARTAAFFSTLERAMARSIKPVADLSHDEFRTFDADRRIHPAHGFVDGDLVESFLDLDQGTMQRVVKEMNRDGGWEIEAHANTIDVDEEGYITPENNVMLLVEDVLAMVEEMTMFH